MQDCLRNLRGSTKRQAMCWSIAALTVVASCVVNVACGDAQPEAKKWGDMSGRFVFRGEQPEPKALEVNKDRQYCKEPIPDESLLVHEENGGIANIAVWLLPAKGEKPEIHPHYAAAAERPITIEIWQCRFWPHMVAVRTEQTLQVEHHDRIGHNLGINLFNNPPWAGLLPAGGKYHARFGKAENSPARLYCNIHPWMSANVIVLDHPYVGITDENGKFEIRNLPVGRWQFRAWHERQGWIKQATINGKAVEWSKGCFEKVVSSGENPLGEMHVAVTK